MIKKSTLTLIAVGILGLVSCSGENQHQFVLEYDNSARLTVVCDNCFYYSNTWDTPVDTIMVDRMIDGEAIALFSAIEFCGVGDTTPDGNLNITTDSGSVAAIGVIFPNHETGQTLKIQSSQTGLGSGCTNRDQRKFEDFFLRYADKTNL
jgi:hypothetical protein